MKPKTSPLDLCRTASAAPYEIEAAHIDEVRRRITQVEAGEMKLVPGYEALEQVRELARTAGGKF